MTRTQDCDTSRPAYEHVNMFGLEPIVEPFSVADEIKQKWWQLVTAIYDEVDGPTLCDLTVTRSRLQFNLFPHTRFT